jgi:NADPH:quinone reductase-like Zn-dependent oxidoreductase
MRVGMKQLLGWIEEGRIQAPPVRTYPLAQIDRDHEDLESGRTVGKLVAIP